MFLPKRNKFLQQTLHTGLAKHYVCINYCTLPSPDRILIHNNTGFSGEWSHPSCPRQNGAEAILLRPLKYLIRLSPSTLFAWNIAFFQGTENALRQILEFSFARLHIRFHFSVSNLTSCIRYCVLPSPSPFLPSNRIERVAYHYSDDAGARRTNRMHNSGEVRN